MTRKHLYIVSLLLWTIGGGLLHAQDLPTDPLPGLGGASAQDVQVDVAIEPARQAPGHPVVAIVTFGMPEGWYIFSDSVGLELISPSGEDAPVRAGELHRPRPKSKFDELLEQQVEYYEGELRVRRVLHLRDEVSEGELNLTLEAAYQACSPNVCYQPTSVELEATLQILPPDAEPMEVTLPQKEEPAKITDGREGAPSGRWADRLEGQGLVATIILSFLAGLALSLTPCVYPMIPITVSIIGATATESRLSGLGRSLVYVLGISLMYAALGLVAAASGRAFGTVLQHPAVYVGLAVLFVLLAAAMFDLFSIQLFSTWANRLQQKVRGRAGLLGILALGVLSGVALTPCGAPVILAAMTYVLKTGNLPFGFLIFFCIAWGMGTPLVIVGTFSGIISSLPQSGGWQETVKRVFGFGLIGAAIYFLGQSLLVGEFWFDMLVAAFLVVTSVFAGAFDTIQPSTGWWTRLCKGVGLLLLVGAGVVFIGSFGGGIGTAPAPERQIQWRESVEAARSAAREQDRPMMIYFTQERCRECRHLEKSTFPDPAVVKASEGLICVKFDGTDSDDPEVKQVMQRYGARIFPTIVFVTPGGEILSDLTVVGFAGPDRLSSLMRRATP